MNIKQTIELVETIQVSDIPHDMGFNVCGWIRTTRTSSATQIFCLINDGSNADGLQLILTDKNISQEKIDYFNRNTQVGHFLKISGTMVDSPAKGQKYEMIVKDYEINGHVDDKYPLAKSKMNLDTLRNFINLRPRTNTFGSVFRIRSKLMKAINDFYHNEDFIQVDPNVITTNECEGGAGVFQLTEKNMSSLKNLPYDKDGKYEWNKDHFGNPVYLTVSSQLQLEIFACSLGNVYTTNKSFRSEHSLTSKHCSEFVHLEIEIINNTLDDLMVTGEKTIKYCINRMLKDCEQDINNLNNFTSKGLKERLNNLLSKPFIKKTYNEVIIEINEDIDENKSLELDKLSLGDDLGSKHEDYITKKYDTGVFCTFWPSEIKSFYMKKCSDTGINAGKCESFDLLMPYGIGELIGGSMREENHEKLLENMRNKNVPENGLEFYTDLRKYGTCIHGGYGMGFERLVMLMTGMKNIRDVMPIPVCYKNCSY